MRVLGASIEYGFTHEHQWVGWAGGEPKGL